MKDKTITDQLISCETAKLAKGKGFTTTEPNYHPWSSSYTEDGQFHETTGMKAIGSGMEIYEAPTQSLLQKWLREEHNIHIVLFGFLNNKFWSYKIYNLSVVSIEFDLPNRRDGGTYEESLEVGLLEALKLIK
jgi:hypothetical protein